MTSPSDFSLWRELADWACTITVCLIGVGIGVSGLAFLVACFCALIDWVRKELN
jgi:hypothetical protein